MEKIKGLAIELDLDHLSVDRGLKGLKDNLRTVNSEMKRNMSAFDFGEKSVKKYETSLSGLNKKLEVQKRAVAEAKKEYEDMVKEHGHGSKEAEKAAREYNNQAASLSNLERYIEKTKNELAEFEKQQRIANSGWTKFGDKLEKAGGKLQTAGKKMGKVGSTLTNKITKPAFGAAAALATLALYKGFQRLVGIDTAKAQLKALGHDAKEVDQIMTAALNAVKGTSHGMDEAATTAASAVAAGVDPAKDLEKYLSLAADTASVANVPFNEMGDIFNKVQTSGKAQNDVLKQLSQRGIPIYQYLGKTIGKSTEEIEKMARDGKIKTKDFLKAVEKNIGGASKIIGEESFAAAWKNIGADIGRIGANFLDAGGKAGGFFSRVKPMLVDFRGWLEKAEDKASDLGVKFGESFEKMVEKAKELKKRYDELTPSQQEFVNKVLMIAPAVAVGVGPALTAFSKLTIITGGTLEIAGKLSKAIGKASAGTGLVAALGRLGPLAVGGIAVAGLTAVGIALYKMNQKSKEAEEINLDVAQSLTDEALALEDAANTFDKLSEKAKISNAELAELNDLNIRISESSNPGEIEQLQKQYNELAKKSGLSKDELKKLFGANKHLIEQSPSVEKSISDQGNAFVKNTEAVQDLINTMLEASRIELEGVREEQLKRQNELKDELIKKERQLADEVQKMQLLDDLRAMSQEEIRDLQWELNEQIQKTQEGSDEYLNLLKLIDATQKAQNGNLDEQFLKQLEIVKEKREDINLTREELAELDAKTQALADIYLQQVGITEQGEKGLAALDKSIAKNDEELAKLDEKLKKNGELTEEEQQRYAELSETTEKQREHRDIIHDELGLYKDLNSLAEAKMESVDKETEKKIESLAKTTDIKLEEGNIVKQLQDKNSEYDKNIEKLEKEKNEQGANKKEINKQIKELKGKKTWNDAILEQVLKELGVWDDVKDSIESGTKKEREKGKAADDTKRKLDAQGVQIDGNNKKTDQGIKKEQERSKEAGKDVDKKVTAKDHGTVATIDRNAQAPKSKKVSLFQSGLTILNAQASAPRSKKINLFQSGLSLINREASKPVNKIINFVGQGLSRLRFWAKGTPPGGHPEDGPAVVGDGGGRELITLPSGKSFLSPDTDTLLNLPKGTHVIPHRQTERIMKAMPRYADGTSGWANALGNSELARLLALNNKSAKTDVALTRKEYSNRESSYIKDLLNATLQQNQILMQLLRKDISLNVDGRRLAYNQEPYITEIQNRNKKTNDAFK
ncbi:tape measure protein [Pseudogracilibacillus auburnensis]|uniref:tape measure protein n=1 Tax=Pseudogracilibacillus auburnensis TaxID=1494959 RepID=UPI001A974FFA|nr:tape measure protein [Pseudogracilibacillus auburnensis]MBO1005604.1 tape measure protein [Pseudogracilibacillus auburnensis]